jgi:hypothetical protein
MHTTTRPTSSKASAAKSSAFSRRRRVVPTRCRPDASTQFWAPPSSACNATYRDAFNKFFADKGPEIVREAALNNEEVANNLYVRARKTQNDRKSTYLTVTIVFAVLFVLHAAALFACIALYR